MAQKKEDNKEREDEPFSIMTTKENTFETVTDIIIRLGFLFVLIALCLQILVPFANLVIWAVLLAVVLEPSNIWLTEKLGGRNKWSATILTMIMLVIVIVPSYLFFDSLLVGVKDMGTALKNGTAQVPPPTEQVKDWPFIGEKLYNIWLQASQDLGKTLKEYPDQISNLGHKLVSSITGLAGGILQIVLATMIAGILMATSESASSFTKNLFKKIVGQRGGEFAEISILTVRNVAKGILGVALIQAFLFGIGLVLADVPYPGLWAVIVMIMAIVQIPPTLVSIPVIIHLYAVDPPLAATLWAIYFLIIGASDNILKPIMLGKGAPVPMLIVFLGAIGGFVVMGFTGLFIGAILLSLGYELFVAWAYGDDEPAKSGGEEDKAENN